MAEELIKEDSIKKIYQCISNNKNFLLEAGAGAGKTYALIESIKYIQNLKTKNKILCITYTNVAKDEILNRLEDDNNIFVSTMHDFLWQFISKFQKDLLSQLKILVQEEINKINQKIIKLDEQINRGRANTDIENKKAEKVKQIDRKAKYESIDYSNITKIEYRNYRALHKGYISHDDVLNITMKFFKKDLFVELFLNSFSYIFIDEYQDSSEVVLKEILSIIKEKKKNRHLVLGLFGDRMQQIYDDGISFINHEEYGLEYIKKPENFRSCKEIIELNNNFRNDDFIQDFSNPHIVKGKIEFIYNLSEDRYLKSFDNINIDEYQRLLLSHSQIAEEVGFKSIYDIFVKYFNGKASEKLKNVDDDFLQYLFNNVLNIIINFNNSKYEVLIKNIFKNSLSKDELFSIKESFNSILNNNNDNIDNIIKKMAELNILNIKKYQDIISYYQDTDYAELINELIDVDYIEYVNFYFQNTGKTKLETFHGVKGAEFENLIINLYESRSWKKYNFAYLLKSQTLDDDIYQRTKRLLYVICTRPKKSLIINYIADVEIENDVESSIDELKKINKHIIR